MKSNLTKDQKVTYDILVDEYASELNWDEGMESHPSDYFTDTSYAVAENFSNLNNNQKEELQNDLEKDVIAKVRAVQYK